MYRNSRMYNFLLHLNKQPKSTILFRPFIKLSFRLRPSEIYSSLFGISSFLMESVIFKIGWVQEIKETHSQQLAQTVGGITCSEQIRRFSFHWFIDWNTYCCEFKDGVWRKMPPCYLVIYMHQSISDTGRERLIRTRLIRSST